MHKDRAVILLRVLNFIFSVLHKFRDQIGLIFVHILCYNRIFAARTDVSAPMGLTKVRLRSAGTVAPARNYQLPIVRLPPVYLVAVQNDYDRQEQERY